MELPTFETKKEKIKFLVENKDTLIAQKKAVTKYADGIAYHGVLLQDQEDLVIKSLHAQNELQVKAVINTTNIMDSHEDVHLDGLWKKSIKENKNIMHIQEHQMAFDKIISNQTSKTLKVSTDEMSFKELGFKFEGNTQALIFDSTVKKSRNPYMHKQYADGNVTNHSVGMQYVKIALAVNDEDHEKEFETWNEHYDKIANKEMPDRLGFFWAVTEAKIIEGSAVPMGSNTVTPTLEIKEPSEDTQTEPLNALEKVKIKKFIKKLLT